MVEFFQNLRQTADRPRQPVDAVHEQKVEAVKASIAEGLLQLRSFQNAARHAVAVAPG